MTARRIENNPIVHFGNSLSRSFDKIQNTIRERAYHIFQCRDAEVGDSVSDWLTAQSEILTPVDLKIKDQKKNIIIQGEVKGFSPDEVEIEIQNGMLTISGYHRESSSRKIADVTESQSSSNSFFQSLSLPAAVKGDKVTAKLTKNGKLTVTLPKKSSQTELE